LPGPLGSLVDIIQDGGGGLGRTGDFVLWVHRAVFVDGLDDVVVVDSVAAAGQNTGIGFACCAAHETKNPLNLGHPVVSVAFVLKPFGTVQLPTPQSV
jgi:hypothetical protein